MDRLSNPRREIVDPKKLLPTASWKNNHPQKRPASAKISSGAASSMLEIICVLFSTFETLKMVLTISCYSFLYLVPRRQALECRHPKEKPSPWIHYLTLSLSWAFTKGNERKANWRTTQDTTGKWENLTILNWWLYSCLGNFLFFWFRPQIIRLCVGWGNAVWGVWGVWGSGLLCCPPSFLGVIWFCWFDVCLCCCALVFVCVSVQPPCKSSSRWAPPPPSLSLSFCHHSIVLGSLLSHFLFWSNKIAYSCFLVLWENIRFLWHWGRTCLSLSMEGSDQE